MAKAVGVDLGGYEVKAVELDGSYKKPRLVKFAAELVATGSSGTEDVAARLSEAALLAIDDGGISKDNMSLSFPCREAVLRILNVPFVGTEQIRKVIKFEAEGSIHSHTVDDMVVDFHEIEPRDAETKVLIAAVPKPPLRALLDGLEASGVEPMVVDLDAMALYRVAEWCGAFSAPQAGSDETGLATGAESQLVFDFGARSTRVLVVNNKQLVDMRTLRTGLDSIAEEIVAKFGIGMADAREAVENSLRSGSDYRFEDPDETPAEGEEGETVPAVRLPVVGYGDVLAAFDRYLGRLRRELIRFLTGVPSSSAIDRVWTTGAGSVLPQVEELVHDVLGVRPEVLDVLGNLSHKLSDEEVEELQPKLAVAVGLALQTLSGKSRLNFRQEDLAFTKGFDRVKFPLALTCMLGLFLVLIYAVGLRQELVRVEREYGQLASDETSEARGRKDREIKFHGYLGTLVNGRGSWFATYYDKREYDRLMARLVERPTFDRLSELRRSIEKQFVSLQQESGYYPDLRLGSGLGAIVELSEVLNGLESRLGRYLLTELDLKLGHQDQNRNLTFKVAMRSDKKSTFREKGDALKSALEAACLKPTSSFKEVHKDTGEKETFQSESGGGYYYYVRIDLKDEATYPVFPPSQS